MPEPLRVCIIVNKTAGKLAYSETFLQAHVSSLPLSRCSLIGNPGRRRSEEGAHPLSLGWLPRASRRIRRSLGLESLEEQDTRALVDYLRQHEIDAVLAEYGPTAVSVSEACRRAAVPLVAHFHGWDAYQMPRDPRVRASYKDLFETAAAVVGVSTHMVRQLESLGAPPNRTFLNIYGVSVPRLPAQPAEAPPKFVAVGRFTPKKAPFLTLLAFAAVRRQVKDASLEMLGDGELLVPTRELARVLKLEDCVTFHGAVSHEVVHDRLREARCFVQHSAVARNGDSEGTPNSVLEAMAMGLPVVSTRHRGIADVVEENVTGMLVDELDVEGMSAAMLNMARDAQAAATIGRRARERVEECWTMEKSLERLAGIIRRAAQVA
jgi:glycosyltransferase involved in cell wall biosynthesis